MTEQNNAQVAVKTFADRATADQAIRALQDAGFGSDHINVVAKDRSEQKDLAAEHHVSAGTGATIGIVEGAAIGLLAGIGGLLIPGIGALAVAGPLAGLLTGGIAGGIAGALAGWGIDAAEAKGYEERVSAGDVLVAVRDNDPYRVAEARRILNGDSAGAMPAARMDTTATTMATTDNMVTGRAATAPTDMTSTNMRSGQDVRVPLMEEELVTDKQRVEEGRVHLHKDVVTEQQTINVPVTREEVHVERVPVSGNYDANTAGAFQDKDIDVPVMGEEVVTEKRAHVVEEVRLRKDQVTENEQVSDTVRKERVVVENDTTGMTGNRTNTR